MSWLVVGSLISVVALVAYAFGKYWLGLGKFRGHVKTINWSAFAGFPDWWHMGLGASVWLNMDPGMHFTSAGAMLRIGPFTCGFNADDTN